MATQPRTTGLTYDDLFGFPDDTQRREIIDGNLFVTPSPTPRHQRVVSELVAALVLHTRQHGGQVYPAPMDVFLSEADVVEPDVLYLGPARLPGTDGAKVVVVPDLVVEVSSPGSRRRDLTVKRGLYERFGVPEYWFVDLEAERLEVYRIRDGRYDAPDVLEANDTLTSSVLSGFSIEVSKVLLSATD